MTVYGDGRQTRSFCYCDDLIDGLLLLMATGEDVTGPINLGNPEEVAIRDLAEMILGLTASRSRIVSRPLPLDDPRRRCPDVSKAKALLGWEPKVSLADGLRETVTYFRHLLS
jgi:UDP-glucuronate decarboxylase